MYELGGGLAFGGFSRLQPRTQLLAPAQPLEGQNHERHYLYLEVTGNLEEEFAGKYTKVFAKRPLMFLQEWLALRRKGQDFSHTPMGHLCQGKPLLESHPFFTKPENDVTNKEINHIQRAGRIKDNTEADVDEDIFDDDAYGDDVGADEADPFDDSQLFEETGSE